MRYALLRKGKMMTGRADSAPDPIIGSPYASARDLPTVRELFGQLRALKLLGLALPKEQKAELKATEQQLRDMVAMVDRFYDLLGARNWVCHDYINLDALKVIVADDADSDEAQRRLISYYQEPETLPVLIQALWSLPPMQPRMELLEKARIDYMAGRYYAVALLLVTVMDGFVNDIVPAKRQGLHAQDAADMNAWGSVTAHHLGLSHAFKEFSRSFQATVTDEVFELNRHGIMHGNIVNFDNEIVASKAWNMLFAVSDWARVRLNPPEPKEPAPTWSELADQMRRSKQFREDVDSWESFTLPVAEVDESADTPLAACRELLEAWKAKRYDLIGKYFPVPATDSIARRAAAARDLYSEFCLTDFEMVALDAGQRYGQSVHVRLRVDEDWHEANMKWLHSRLKIVPGMSQETTTWYLCPHGPPGFVEGLTYGRG